VCKWLSNQMIFSCSRSVCIMACIGTRTIEQQFLLVICIYLRWQRHRSFVGHVCVHIILCNIWVTFFYLSHATPSPTPPTHNNPLKTGARSPGKDRVVSSVPTSISEVIYYPSCNAANALAKNQSVH